MGAWGDNSFDNDQSLDWFAMDVVESSGGAAAIEKALDMVIDAMHLGGGEIDNAVAAAEIVATALGKRPEDGEIPDEVEDWLRESQFRPTESQRALAISALGFVLTEDEDLSEYADSEVWCDDDARQQWYSAVRNLLERLSTAALSDEKTEKE